MLAAAASEEETVKRITRQFCGNLFAISSPIGFEWEEAGGGRARPKAHNDEQHGQEEKLKGGIGSGHFQLVCSCSRSRILQVNEISFSIY